MPGLGLPLVCLVNVFPNAHATTANTGVVIHSISTKASKPNSFAYFIVSQPAPCHAQGCQKWNIFSPEVFFGSFTGPIIDMIPKVTDRRVWINHPEWHSSETLHHMGHSYGKPAVIENNLYLYLETGNTIGQMEVNFIINNNIWITVFKLNVWTF